MEKQKVIWDLPLVRRVWVFLTAWKIIEWEAEAR